MQIEAGRPQRRSLIGLTPLIDVVFILLLFFLLASNFLQWHSITLSTPTTQGIVTNTSRGAMLIRLTANGTIDINGQIVAIDQLTSKLKPILVSNPEQRILIRPSRGVPLQAVVKVLDLLRNTGAEQISLTR